LLFFWFRRQKERGGTWIFEEINKENQGKKIWGITQWHWFCLYEAFQELASWYFYPVMVMAVFGLFTAVPYQKAKNFAEEQMSLYQQHGCQNENQKYHCASLIDSSDNKVLIQGILISANDNRVAIYNNKIEIWPLLDNYIIRQNKPVNMDKVGDKK
jgi:hypothetical protein